MFKETANAAGEESERFKVTNTTKLITDGKESELFYSEDLDRVKMVLLSEMLKLLPDEVLKCEVEMRKESAAND